MDASLPSIFTFSFVLAIGAVISPGPVSTAIVSQAARHGWRVGPLVALGHSLLELVIVLAIAFGLERVLGHAIVRTLIALLGGLLLLWMGGAMLRDLLRGRVRLPRAAENAPSLNQAQLVRLGVLATIANPFWYAWWLTVPPSYLAQASAVGLAPLAAFFFGHISADFAWDTALSGLVSGGRRWINDRVYAAIIAVCAAFFVYLGFVFVGEGLSLLGWL